MGYTVESFTSGEDALAHIKKKEPPDILVSDVSLPGMDGRELASELRVFVPNLPVLLMSGAEILRDGPWQVNTKNLFLAKPFTATVFANELRKARDFKSLVKQRNPLAPERLPTQTTGEKLTNP